MNQITFLAQLLLLSILNIFPTNKLKKVQWFNKGQSFTIIIIIIIIIITIIVIIIVILITIIIRSIIIIMYSFYNQHQRLRYYSWKSLDLDLLVTA